MKNLNASDDRTPRELETREAESREPSWIPPATLPAPHQRPGWVHRYIRTSINGQPDPANINSAFHEGWEPVRAADYPELSIRSDHTSQYKDGIEIGGLLLCRAPVEKMKARMEYYRQTTENQMTSVNSQLDANRDVRFGSMFRDRDHRSFTTVGARRFGPDGRGERNGPRQP